MNTPTQTIILTSSGQFATRNNVDEYLPKPIKDCKIAYIITASKNLPNPGDDKYLQVHKAKMDKLGWDYAEIDIAGKTEGSLRELLSNFDIIMVEGGNTFYLLKAIRESGFEKIVRELLDRGIVYIGSSAGSYVACPSIIVADWSTRGFDRCGITDFTAMNLVPFLVYAHFDEKKADILQKKKHLIDLQTKTLTDNQALVIQNGKVKLIED